MDKYTNEKVKQVFTAFLQNKKLRRTPERYGILEEIYMQEGHFDVESLYLKMKAKEVSISRATVYNTLDLLVESNLVTKHQFGQQQAQYEKSYGFRQHDHMICTDCQQVSEFCDPRIQNIQTTMEELLGFSVMHHSLIFYGTCTKENCENKKVEKTVAIKQQ